jgi:hypothetical protein
MDFQQPQEPQPGAESLLAAMLRQMEQMQLQHQQQMQQQQLQHQQYEQAFYRMLQQQSLQPETAPGPAPSGPAPSASTHPLPATPRPTFRPNPPATFYGPDEDVRSWIFRADAYFRLFAEDGDAWRLSQVPSLLGGDALTWWRFRIEQPAVPGTWAAFAIELTTTYRPINADYLDRAAFTCLKQTGGVRAYVAEFQRLLLRVPGLPVEDQVFRFVEGLGKAVRVHVRMAGPQTLQDAMLAAARADAASAPLPTARGSGPIPMELGALGGDGEGDGDELAAVYARPPMRSVGAVRGGDRGRTGPASTPPPGAGIPRLTEAVRAECRRLGLCFRCRKPGHRTADCTAFDAARPNA